MDKDEHDALEAALDALGEGEVIRVDLGKSTQDAQRELAAKMADTELMLAEAYRKLRDRGEITDAELAKALDFIAGDDEEAAS